MKNIFSHPDIETKNGSETGGATAVAPMFSLLASAIASPVVRPEEEAAPVRKRGTFLSGKFFGGKGKDKEPVSPVDEELGTIRNYLQDRVIIPAQNGGGSIAFETGTSGEDLVPLILPALVPSEPHILTAAAPEPVAQDSSAVPVSSAVAEPDTNRLAPAAAPKTTDAPRITLPHSSTPSQPRPIMTPTETTHAPADGRATAQLTIPFEITSLQLTPSFKLGSVQLKALSNVVSLHLVAAQEAGNPLAAGISFQIEHVDLDDASHLKSLLLKPLGEAREMTAPLPKLQVDNVAVADNRDGAPIRVTTSGQVSTAVQVFGTFVIAAMDFTPAFEIGALRLEPASGTVLVRVAPSSQSTAQDLPPSFEIAEIQLGDGAQIAGARVIPKAAGKA